MINTPTCKGDRTQGGPMENILLRRKPVVRVKNILEDDVYGLWRVKKIVVKKGRQRLCPHAKEKPSVPRMKLSIMLTLERNALLTVRLGLNQHNGQRRAAMKYVAMAAFISVMTVIAVQRFRDLIRDQ